MTTQETIILAFSVSIAALTLVGAFAARRLLLRAGAGLRAADEGLQQRALAIPVRLAEVRSTLTTVNAQAEHALWLLGNLDDRLDKTTVDLRAKRVASDSLRVRLIEGRLSIARLRQLVRLLMRLGELRRTFLE